MKPFDYSSPRSLNESCAVLAELGDGVRILAGGTDVLVELRKPSARLPKSIIDISRIAALKGITESGDSIIIGALTTHDEVHRSELIAKYAPLLRSAVSMIGSPQIRNRGTIGGNIMNAAACADTVPPLMTLNARLKLNSSLGEREIALTDFFVKPYVTIAHPDEILSEIRFHKLSPDMRSSFVKLGRRNALSIARLSVAVVLKVDDKGLIEEARIVPGAAFPCWQRIQEAEEMLVGQSPSQDIFVKAGKKVSEMMISHTGRRWSTEYKEPVIAVLVRRALEQCSDKEKKA
jgi:carbon-monoxide dehydrogenase medium subunit/xanthine dehydrogenase FAD-binding subunit